MLDIHTHILPGMDDGSRSIEQSIAMLQAEQAQGVDTIVLTPHYDAHRESPEEFSQRRAKAAAQLLSALENMPSHPWLILGAETAFFEGISQIDDLSHLCIQGTQALLIEMPFCEWSKHMLSELESLLQFRGIRPILAHIERYRSFQSPRVFEELHESGIWLQCNATFFTKWQTTLPAMGMLKRRLIHFVASDCHGIEYRPPNLGEAMGRIRKKLGDEAWQWLSKNEQALLGGMQ